MDIKTKKEKHKKFNNVHPETPIRTLKELFFVSDGQGVLLKNHPLNPCKTFYLEKTVYIKFRLATFLRLIRS
jgi:hypothetical protein